MDGRDLIFDICPKYTSSHHIYELANKIPKFIVSLIVKSI